MNIIDVIKAAIEQNSACGGYRTVDGETIRIQTKISRDPSRRNNGGEYDFWLKVWRRDGRTYARTCCSCDFWQPNEGQEIEGTARAFDDCLMLLNV
jgi:hypothetical protein